MQHTGQQKGSKCSEILLLHLHVYTPQLMLWRSNSGTGWKITARSLKRMMQTFAFTHAIALEDF